MFFLGDERFRMMNEINRLHSDIEIVKKLGCFFVSSLVMGPGTFCRDCNLNALQRQLHSDQVGPHRVRTSPPSCQCQADLVKTENIAASKASNSPIANMGPKKILTEQSFISGFGPSPATMAPKKQSQADKKHGIKASFETSKAAGAKAKPKAKKCPKSLATPKPRCRPQARKNRAKKQHPASAGV